MPGASCQTYSTEITKATCKVVVHGRPASQPAMLGLLRVRSLSGPLRSVGCTARSVGCTASRLLAQQVVHAPPRIACRSRSTLPLGPAAATALGLEAVAPTPASALVPLELAGSRAVGWWLLGTAGCVFGMVVVGGITRLTRSGLSMVDWRPQGRSYPRSTAEWEIEFDKYKQFPEYQRMHAGTGMTLDDFKGIYFWEWFHRMCGRGIGFVFGVPLAYFAVRGHVSRALAPTLAGLFLLGGSQGLVSWLNVPSALSEDSAPSASLGRPKAQAAPMHPGAKPEPLGSSPWLREAGSGHPNNEGFPLSTTRLVGWWMVKSGLDKKLVRCLHLHPTRAARMPTPARPSPPLCVLACAHGQP